MVLFRMCLIYLLIVSCSSCGDRQDATHLKGTFQAKSQDANYDSFTFSEDFTCSIFEEISTGRANQLEFSERRRYPCSYEVKGTSLTVTAKGLSGEFRWRGTISADRKTIIHSSKKYDIYVNEDLSEPVIGVYLAQGQNPYAAKIHFKSDNTCDFYEPIMIEIPNHPPSGASTRKLIRDPEGKTRLLSCTYHAQGKELDVRVKQGSGTTLLHSFIISSDAKAILLSNEWKFVKQERTRKKSMTI